MTSFVTCVSPSVRRPPQRGVAGSAHRRQERCTTRAWVHDSAPPPRDRSFTLAEESEAQLASQLSDEEFLQEIVSSVGCVNPNFTGLLFQPQAYSTRTPRGVPSEFEPFLADPHYIVIHVKQMQLFSAGIFRPSKLCAIYSVDLSEEQEAAARKRTSGTASADEEAWAQLGFALRQPEKLDDDSDVDLDSMVI